jgi:hypothetical protein
MKPMKNTRAALLDDLAHDLNSMRVILNIWEERMPSVVVRVIRKRIRSMDCIIGRLKKWAASGCEKRESR